MLVVVVVVVVVAAKSRLECLLAVVEEQCMARMDLRNQCRPRLDCDIHRDTMPFRCKSPRSEAPATQESSTTV